MIDADDLPEGWVLTTLGNVVRVNYGKALPSGLRIEGDFKVFGSSGVVGTHTQAFTSGASIIIGRKGSIGSIFWSHDPCWPIDTVYFIDQPGPFYPQYLLRYLDHIALKSLDSSTAIPGLNRDDLYGIAILIPPLPEQKRIVARLEALQARSRAAREALAEVPTLLEQYRQSVLAAAFRGDLTATWREQHHNAEPASILLDRIRADRRKQWEAKYPKKRYVEPTPVDDTDLPELPEGWYWESLENLCDSERPISYGILKPGDFEPEGIPMLRITDMVRGKVDLAGVHRVPNALSKQYQRTLLQGGEILISLVGTIGVTAVTGSGCMGANVHRNLGVIAAHRFLSVEYLCNFMRSHSGQSQLRKFTTGANQPLLNLGDLRLMVIPIPSRAEQTETDRRLSIQLEFARNIVGQITEISGNLIDLDQSLLAKAFRGELVEQDPADEPASVLLERIRASATAGGVSAKRSRSR